MSFSPTLRAKHLLASWRESCLEVNGANQAAFNQVLSQIRGELKYKIMPRMLYPHGSLVEQVKLSPRHS